MKSAEPAIASVASVATVASAAAEWNHVVTLAVSVLTLAWWVRVWIRGGKEKPPKP